jgi:aminoglycoside phosphotransferase (APT) family kinase protein
LIAAARLLRRAHDVTHGSALAGDMDVVCHGDPSPVNFIWRDGRPVALIDWDAAHPGDRIQDVAYMAWMFVLGGGGDDTGYAGMTGQAQRLRVLCDAYGLDDRRDLIDAIEQEQTRVAAGIARDRGKRSPGRVAEVLAWVSGEAAWLRANRVELTRFL